MVPPVGRWCLAIGGASLLTLGAMAEAPHIYALTNLRIVTAVGEPIARGTIVVRNGLIEAVGASVAVPPDAHVIEGVGLTVYPGLIDLGNRSAASTAEPPLPQNVDTREETERWKRSVLLRPEAQAARHVRVDSEDLTRLPATGITSVLAVPTGDVFKGQSALVNVVAPADEPQIGGLADERRGRVIVRTPVALHLAMPVRARGNAYPLSLMGMVSFVRQAFLDARHYRTVHVGYEQRTGVPRPVYDESLEALGPALDRRVPVVFEAQTNREIRRALAMAQEFGLDPIIEGAHDGLGIADELKRAGARVVFSLNLPSRPATLAPDADEPIRQLRLRATAASVPAELHKAGVVVAFASAGLRDPKQFLTNAAKVVAAGLPRDTALRALTIDAAAIAGVSDRLGSIEAGKFANLVVTEGDLFDEGTKVRHVFVDGRPVPLGPVDTQ